jgi:hypothetical protein
MRTGNQLNPKAKRPIAKLINPGQQRVALPSLPAQGVRESALFVALQETIRVTQEGQARELQELEQKLALLRDQTAARRQDCYHQKMRIWEARDSVMSLTEQIAR